VSLRDRAGSTLDPLPSTTTNTAIPDHRAARIHHERSIGRPSLATADKGVKALAELTTLAAAHVELLRSNP
jgi:hypothetical protein